MEADVCCWTSIAAIGMVEESSRRTLGSIVKLDKDEIEIRLLNCVRQMNIRHDTLRSA